MYKAATGGRICEKKNFMLARRSIGLGQQSSVKLRTSGKKNFVELDGSCRIMSNITRIGSLRWRFIHAWQETSASTCPSSASTFADSRHTDNFANATWDAFALKQVKNVLFPAVFPLTDQKARASAISMPRWLKYKSDLIRIEKVKGYISLISFEYTIVCLR